MEKLKNDELENFELHFFMFFIFYHDMVYFRSLIKTIAKNKD